MMIDTHVILYTVNSMIDTHAILYTVNSCLQKKSIYDDIRLDFHS